MKEEPQVKQNLTALASTLSLAQIKSLIKLKSGGKRLRNLEKLKKKLARQIAKVDAKIAAMTGDPQKKVKVGRPPKHVKAKTGKKVVKTAATKKTTSKRATGLMAFVRKVFETAKKPMKVADVVGALPKAGFKVGNKEAKVKSSLASIMGSKKTIFKRVGKGLYELVG